MFTLRRVLAHSGASMLFFGASETNGVEGGATVVARSRTNDQIRVTLLRKTNKNSVDVINLAFAVGAAELCTPELEVLDKMTAKSMRHFFLSNQ